MIIFCYLCCWLQINFANRRIDPAQVQQAFDQLANDNFIIKVGASSVPVDGGTSLINHDTLMVVENDTTKDISTPKKGSDNAVTYYLKISGSVNCNLFIFK